MKKNQKKNQKKNLHLSYKDRCIIQEFLTYGYSFTAIANRIPKDRTTISKEIRNHCFVKPFRGNNEVNCSLLLNLLMFATDVRIPLGVNNPRCSMMLCPLYNKHLSKKKLSPFYDLFILFIFYL